REAAVCIREAHAPLVHRACAKRRRGIALCTALGPSGGNEANAHGAKRHAGRQADGDLRSRAGWTERKRGIQPMARSDMPDAKRTETCEARPDERSHSEEFSPWREATCRTRSGRRPAKRVRMNGAIATNAR